MGKNVYFSAVDTLFQSNQVKNLKQKLLIVFLQVQMKQSSRFTFLCCIV